MGDKKQLIMLSAMFENGGNTLHRHLDGHPELLTYPFESQLGNKFSKSKFSGFFAERYEWPEFPEGLTPEQYYELFWDEEVKTRLRSPNSSKFKNADIELDEAKRKQHFIDAIAKHGNDRTHLIYHYFEATFAAWSNHNTSGKEHIYAGFCPVVAVHAERLFKDFPNAKMIHIVRNPFHGYRDTKTRPYPVSLYDYATNWSIVQLIAMTMAERYPANFRMVKFEHLFENTELIMKELAEFLGIAFDNAMLYPSFNGKQLDAKNPWGVVSMSAIASSDESGKLSAEEEAAIKSLSLPILTALDYLEL